MLSTCRVRAGDAGLDFRLSQLGACLARGNLREQDQLSSIALPLKPSKPARCMHQSQSLYILALAFGATTYEWHSVHTAYCARSFDCRLSDMQP